ncbi:phosphoesterase [Phycisphaerae bacterium]|jgi:predicted phosphodiesterase|nr:phosphoesterase [Phycisphaerae bacterium]
MPTAVISDVHANAVALKAVLADIDARGIQRIICLGDTVGYGPDPLECVDIVRARCAWSLLGNHDFAVLYEPTNFNPNAELATHWTREQFETETDEAKKASRYEFLNHLKVRVAEHIGADGPQPMSSTPTAMRQLLAVHGSPRKPINEYIFPEDAANNPDKLESIFDRVQGICIVGHTHVPGVFTNEPDFYSPMELGETGYRFRDGEKAVINVGSVGQPRDRDNRASYAILHATHVEFVRIAYNIDETANKIRSVSQLPSSLADRLYTGE